MSKIISAREIYEVEKGFPFESLATHEVVDALLVAQRNSSDGELFDMLLAHKEYQRHRKGGMQILFGFSPDELNQLRGKGG